MAASVSTQVRKATGARAWRRQYRPSSVAPASSAWPGHAAHVGDLRGCGPEAVDRSLEFVQGRLHQRAVIGGALAQSANPHLLGLEALHQALDRLCRAADHLVHPVVSGDAHRYAATCRVHLLDRVRHPLRGGEHCGHGAVCAQRAHEGAAGGREPQAVLEAERPGGPRGRDLPEAVAHHHVRSDADAGPQCGQGAFDRVDAGLGPGRVVELAVDAVGAEHHIEQRDPPLLSEQFVAAVDDSPEHGLALVERPAHALPLAGLAGVGRRRPWWRASAPDPGRGRLWPPGTLAATRCPRRRRWHGAPSGSAPPLPSMPSRPGVRPRLGRGDASSKFSSHSRYSAAVSRRAPSVLADRGSSRAARAAGAAAAGPGVPAGASMATLVGRPDTHRLGSAVSVDASGVP